MRDLLEMFVFLAMIVGIMAFVLLTPNTIIFLFFKIALVPTIGTLLLMILNGDL